MKENKLIAEFMGGILSSVPNLINLPQTIGESNIFCVKGSEGLPSGTYKVERIDDLKYHESWGWLMPVVEKIEDMGCEVVITNGECTISGADNCDYYVESIGKNRRGATYDAVVEFINQLNK